MQVETYAPTENMVKAVMWKGGERNFASINAWSGNKVRLLGTNLVLQEPGRTNLVQLGDYIVQTDPTSFYAYTYQELKDIYARVEVKSL